MDRKRNSNWRIAEKTWRAGIKVMGTTAAIIDSRLITDRGSRDKLGREMDNALLRFRSRFCRSVFRYLGNAADAGDAVQDALLSAYKHLSKFRAGTDIDLAAGNRDQFRADAVTQTVPSTTRSVRRAESRAGKSCVVRSAGGPWADARGGMSRGRTCRARSSVVATALTYFAESISTARTGRPHHSRNRECSRSR